MIVVVDASTCSCTAQIVLISNFTFSLQVLRGAVPTVRNAVIRMPHNNAKSKMSNFLGKLRSGAGETDKEVLKLLTHANVLRAIGEQIKGDHVQEGDSRLEVVHEMKRRYAERERKMREREVREAKKLQDSIDAENNIVFGIPEVGAHVSDEEHEQQVRREHQNASDEKHEDSEGMRSDAPHGQHEDKIRVRSNAIDKEHEDRERRKSRARGRSAIEGRGKDSSWRHTVEGDGWEDADISSRRGGVVTGQSRYSHSMAYAHRDKESSAFDDDWADKPSVRGEFQFRDEAVPASSATGRAVHRESENDGSGPVEMSRVRALGFSTPEQVLDLGSRVADRRLVHGVFVLASCTNRIYICFVNSCRFRPRLLVHVSRFA